MWGKMSALRRHERKAQVQGISAADAIERYKYCLSKKFNSIDVEDRGQYVVMHKRINIQNRQRIDVIVFSNDRIFVSASPRVSPEVFNRVATEVIRMAQDSVQRLEEVRPLTLLRAKSILEFASKLDVNNEYERMVAVILADTSNEIVLTEEMQAIGIQGPPLNEGIPEKIRRLKDKGKVVYEEEGVRNTRELRNGIVHRGDIPDKNQTIKALEVANNVLRWYLRE